ncbi:kinase-like protein, partial [Ramicandelaber brevisporus]
MRTLANLGLCPPLYAKIQGGLVYGYIEGRVVAVPEMADKHISMLIAKKLAEWHTTAEPPTISPSPSVQGSPAVTVSANGNGASLTVPKVANGIHYDQFGAGGHQSKLFVTLRKWLGAVPAKYDNPQKQALFAASFNVDELAAELDMLEEHLASLNSPIVFCHNDLLSANIIYNPECDQVAFIDYEYGAFGPRGFDIGNHFAEYAGFECEYDRVPNRRQQLTWLSTYFEAAYDRKPEKSELEALFVEANKYLLVSHVYWGLWALVQAKLSDIDFDYLGYAKMRFEEYHNDRDFILSLKVS